MHLTSLAPAIQEQRHFSWSLSMLFLLDKPICCSKTRRYTCWVVFDQIKISVGGPFRSQTRLAEVIKWGYSSMCVWEYCCTRILNNTLVVTMWFCTLERNKNILWQVINNIYLRETTSNLILRTYPTILLIIEAAVTPSGNILYCNFEIHRKIVHVTMTY